jgi:GT2 family glycosyltransferase
MAEPDLSIVIVNWNTYGLLAQCLWSLYDTLCDVAFEVIVVDNGSSDGSTEMVRQVFPRVLLVQNEENVGFARGNNQGLMLSRGRYVLLLNSDTIARPGAVSALLNLAESQPRAGIVGARLVNPDGSFQASHTPFPTLWQEFLILTGIGRLLLGTWFPSRGPDEDGGPREVDYVEGACLLVRHEAIAEVGGLNEAYFMYSEEVDWCYSMACAGWEVWYQPAAEIVHLQGGSSRHRQRRREADLYRSRVRFFRLHYGERTARLLQWQMYALTAVKIVAHGLLRLLSGGRRGRPVVPLRRLALALKDA